MPATSTDFILDYGDVVPSADSLSSADFDFQSGIVAIATNGSSADFQFTTVHLNPPICGNGVVEGTEACDDGNAISGDGCSAICAVETVTTSASGGGGGGSGYLFTQIQTAEPEAPEAPEEVPTVTPTEPTEEVVPEAEPAITQPTIAPFLRPSAPEIPVPEVGTEAPEQLFDISIEIDDPIITDINDLTARAILESFGTVPTPIELDFIIRDEFGEDVYTVSEHLVVETEAVKTERFEGLDLPPGKYTLFLETAYGDGIFDEFSQSFEIEEIQAERSIYDICKDLPLALRILLLVMAIIGTAVVIKYLIRKIYKGPGKNTRKKRT